MPQSQTADKPMTKEEQHNLETPWRQTKQSNQLSLPHQDDCKTRMDTEQHIRKHRTITESRNGSNNQQQQNHRLRMDSSQSHWET